MYLHLWQVVTCSSCSQGNMFDSHISPVLMRLHWLPVKARVEFKILLLCHKAVHGAAPAYLTDMIQLWVSLFPKVKCSPPHTKCKSFGDRSFYIGCASPME